MARKPRKYGSTGVYHVIIRGINREKIFENDCEKLRLIEIFTRNFINNQDVLNEQLFAEANQNIGCGDCGDRPKNSDCDTAGVLFAFCIMDNHLHLLVKESKKGISNLMQRIATAYAGFYNRRRGRSGPVFESRYTSRAVDSEKYFVKVINYIHNNPVAAGVSNSPEAYPWGSLYYSINHKASFIAKNIAFYLRNDFYAPDESAPLLSEDILKCSWPLRISDAELEVFVQNEFAKRQIDVFNLAKHLYLVVNAFKNIISLKGATKSQLARLLKISNYQLNRGLMQFS